MVKKALEENPMAVKVLVDNTTALNNIGRFGRNSGYLVSVKEISEDFLITLVKK